MSTWFANRGRRAGFTIIELLVTILLIGLLLSAAMISYNTARMNGRDGQRLGDIFQISQAIDQSATLNRGQYPVNAVGGNGSVMCANELQDSTNKNGLDLSLFRSRTIPVDPLPVSRAAGNVGCLTYQNGYTYHTTSSALIQNLKAQGDGYSYLLEFGLEREANGTLHPNDSTQKINESPIFNGTKINQPAVTTPRYQYFLLGKFCGSNC